MANNATPLIELSLAITKATHDGHWQAVASDTLPDKTTESTSLSLFQDWIQRAETGVTVAWLPLPRMPFLGVSHYPSLDGYGEAGATEKMHIDGNRFKPRGTFDIDNPVGKSLFNTVRRERELIAKGESVEDPIRISAAWWDISHSHGTFIFERKSLTDVCPMCAQGAGHKVYLKGQLDHFAATRVPINPRTSLGLEEKSMAITRKDDAASIVDEELAEELDKKARLVGKSETEASALLIVKAKPKPHMTDEEIAAMDDEEPGDTESDDDADSTKDKPAKKKAGPFEAVANGLEGAYQPLGGALTMDAADEYIRQGQLVNQAYSNYDVYTMVMQNVLSFAPEMDKMSLIQQATADLNERIATIKAAVVDAWLIDPAIASPTKGDYSDMSNDIFDTMRDAVNGAIEAGQSRQETVETIQKAFTQMAAQIERQVDNRFPQSQAQAIAEAVKAAISPLQEEVGLLRAKLGQPVQTITVPQQKSYVAGQQFQPVQPTEQHAISPVTGKPSALTDMIRRSVGIVS